MAIILEQEKRQLPIGSILTVVFIAGILLFALYYLFINRPDIVDIVIPTQTRDITEMARRTTVDSEALLARLGARTGTPAPEIDKVEKGKENPFTPFTPSPPPR